MTKKSKTTGQSELGYVKPDFIKVERMIFMFEPYKSKYSIVACRQCSSCHGCR